MLLLQIQTSDAPVGSLFSWRLILFLWLFNFPFSSNIFCRHLNWHAIGWPWSWRHSNGHGPWNDRTCCHWLSWIFQPWLKIILQILLKWMDWMIITSTIAMNQVEPSSTTCRTPTAPSRCPTRVHPLTPAWGTVRPLWEEGKVLFFFNSLLSKPEF